MKTSEKIIESMYNLIASEGYEKASINKICSDAGVVKSSFYHYFKTKEEVLELIMKEIYFLDYEKEIDVIKKLTNPSEYKKYLKDQLTLILLDYKNNNKERRFNAEVDLLIDKIPFVKQIIINTHVSVKKFFVNMFEHGVKIKALSKKFDVKVNSDYLLTTLIGIDSIILLDIPVDYDSLVDKMMEGIFNER